MEEIPFNDPTDVDMSLTTPGFGRVDPAKQEAVASFLATVNPDDLADPVKRTHLAAAIISLMSKRPSRSDLMDIRRQWEATLPERDRLREVLVRVAFCVSDALESAGMDSSAFIWGSDLSNAEKRLIYVASFSSLNLEARSSEEWSEFLDELAFSPDSSSPVQAVDLWNGDLALWQNLLATAGPQLLGCVFRPAGFSDEDWEEWMHLDVESLTAIESRVKAQLSADDLVLCAWPPTT